MKLISLSFNAVPRMPGMRPGDISTVELEKKNALQDWRISIRGQQVFFVSPPGWVPGETKSRDPDGPVTIFEVPRAEVTFQWRATAAEIDAVLKSGKYDSEPIGWTPPPPEGEKPAPAVPPGQMGDA